MFVKRALALEPVERLEAAGGGRMLAGTEGQSGVDLEIDPIGIGRVGRRVDMEPSGADRLKARLAHRHPILLAELLDLRRARAEDSQDRHLLTVRVMVEIGMDQPFVGLGGIGLVGDEHRRIVGAVESIFRIDDRLALRARTWNRDPEAHGLAVGGAASFASRSLSCSVRAAA
jgi:hypothetical protein